MKNIPAYLNDHLAGSVAAVELLSHLVKPLEGTPLAEKLAGLRVAIEEDQAVLQRMVAAHGGESVLRKAAGWMAEKITRWKISADGEHFGELGLLEALEILALGITGKRMLWDSLSTMSDGTLVSKDELARLRARAEEQLHEMEAQRMAAAYGVFN